MDHLQPFIKKISVSSPESEILECFGLNTLLGLYNLIVVILGLEIAVQGGSVLQPVENAFKLFEGD